MIQPRVLQIAKDHSRLLHYRLWFESLSEQEQREEVKRRNVFIQSLDTLVAKDVRPCHTRSNDSGD